MLHLENFFEKSFALLLTTPRNTGRRKLVLLFLQRCAILSITDAYKGLEQRGVGNEYDN